MSLVHRIVTEDAAKPQNARTEHGTRGMRTSHIFSYLWMVSALGTLTCLLEVCRSQILRHCRCPEENLRPCYILLHPKEVSWVCCRSRSGQSVCRAAKEAVRDFGEAAS